MLRASHLALAAVLLVTLAAVAPVSADDMSAKEMDDAVSANDTPSDTKLSTPAQSVAVAAEGAAKTDDKPAGVRCGVEGFHCLAYAGDAALLSPRADAKTLYRRPSLGSR
jgi:hypothetical protein